MLKVLVCHVFRAMGAPSSYNGSSPLIRASIDESSSNTPTIRLFHGTSWHLLCEGFFHVKRNHVGGLDRD